MPRKLLFLLFALLATSGLYAQSGTLKGTVKDSKTGELLPMANIALKLNGSTVTGGATDFDGAYTIKPIPAGKYNIEVTVMGYKTQTQTGVQISAGKIEFLNFKLSSTLVDIGEVEVVSYKVPLISKDQTQSGGSVTSEAIAKMPGRDIGSVAATVGGVYSADGGKNMNIRGARSDGTSYYVDGVKVRGSNDIPKSSVEQIDVILGGTPAKYGDFTGGIVSVTTKGAAKEYQGGIDILTSQYLDKYGYNLFSVNLSGPLYQIKDSRDTTRKRSLIGFFLAAEGSSVKDGDPSYVDLYQVKSSIRDSLVRSPLRPTGLLSGGTYKNADFLGAQDFEKVDCKQDAQKYQAMFSGKIDVQPTDNFNITIGGTFDYQNQQIWDWSNRLFNSENNGVQKYTNWRAYARITQKFVNSSEDDSKKALIKNAYYQLQVDYSKTNSVTQDADHKDDFFKYGYVGKFKTYKTKGYGYGYDTIAGLTGWLQETNYDTLFSFEYSDVNPELSRWTQQYYDLYNRPGDQMNKTIVEYGGALLNGQMNNTNTRDNKVYNIFTMPGMVYNSYQKADQSQFRVSANGSADVKDHEISLGFEFEQRDDRLYSVNDPTMLWVMARQWTNFHIQDLDKSNPILVKTDDGVFQDTINYNRLYSASTQAQFDINFREHLGLAINSLDWIDIDNYDPSELKLEYFSPDELLNQGSNLVTYYGYDYKGNRLTYKPSLDDFFLTKDANGRYKREIAPFEPSYVAGYIQDKFAFNDLVFNIGLRVDRYDANQMVLKDKYCFYETVKAGDDQVDALLASTGTQRPSNIGDNYVVYVDNYKNATKIMGYRNGDRWFNASGVEITDPSLIYSGGVINPYVTESSFVQSGSGEVLQLTSKGFKDYQPQTSVLPRISFSFPISDEALFFAHYDILSSRPTAPNRLNPLNYLYIQQYSSRIISNPDLKNEQTIDYELGFQQKVSNSSSIKLSGFYREIRDQQQSIPIEGGFPADYYTYGNIDFGTVKGITVSYDLRRTGNVSLRLNYTLQFANGTGSNIQSGINLVQSGQPNLRINIPYDYDQRHAIQASVDYRYGGKVDGSPYNGPTLAGKDLLQNTGFNLVAQFGSGTPYSRQLRPEKSTNFFGESGGVLDGSVNGSLKPWTSTLNLRIDRDISLAWREKEGTNEKKKAYMNIYLDISNLLNTQRILNVYGSTGNANDDGYLAAAEFQNEISASTNEESFRYYYAMAINSPYNYGAPRTIRLGVMLNF